MLHPSANGIQCRYFLQELTFFIDDKCSGWHCIFHLYLLDLGSIVHSKRNFFRHQIAIRSHFFTKGIRLPGCESFNQMFLTLYRLPCIYHISILIKHRKRCPGKFHACRNIGLRKGYFCRLVLKYRFQLYHFHILSLIFGSHFQSLKRRDIPCRSCKFFDIVSTKWKVNVKYCLSIFSTDCFSK